MTSPSSAACRADAKVNLYLDVVGKRPDGYHNLETLFLTVPWGDDVTVTLRGTAEGDTAPLVTLDTSGGIAVPDGEGNIAWRAAAAFVAAAAEGPGALPAAVHVDLKKRVPVGAGLGGGSADAAAVLRLLAGLIPGRVSDDRLQACARSLGADVPFLLLGGAAVGRERGDRLEPVASREPLELLLILPPGGCDTAAVFGGFRRFRAAPRDGLRLAVDALASGEPGRLREAHYNALAFTVLKMHPPMRRFTADVERRLERQPAMSGSGSALFDILDAGEADDVLARLDGLPGARVVVRVE